MGKTTPRSSRETIAKAKQIFYYVRKVGYLEDIRDLTRMVNEHQEDADIILKGFGNLFEGNLGPPSVGEITENIMKKYFLNEEIDRSKLLSFDVYQLEIWLKNLLGKMPELKEYYDESAQYDNRSGHIPINVAHQIGLTNEVVKSIGDNTEQYLGGIDIRSGFVDIWGEA